VTGDKISFFLITCHPARSVFLCAFAPLREKDFHAGGAKTQRKPASFKLEAYCKMNAPPDGKAGRRYHALLNNSIERKG
jgi:hypothetical protein